MGPYINYSPTTLKSCEVGGLSEDWESPRNITWQTFTFPGHMH